MDDDYQYFTTYGLSLWDSFSSHVQWYRIIVFPVSVKYCKSSALAQNSHLIGTDVDRAFGLRAFADIAGRVLQAQYPTRTYR